MQVQVSQFKVRWKILIFNYLCMPIWPVSVKVLTIQSSTSGWHVPAQNRWNFQWHAKHVWDCGQHLVIGYDKDGADHDAAVHKMLLWCEEVNLQLNKEKCHFKCTSIPSFGEVISREGVQPDPQKIKALMYMPVPKNQQELQAILGIIILENFPQAPLMYMIPYTSWHPVRWHAHGMHHTRHHSTRLNHL